MSNLCDIIGHLDGFLCVPVPSFTGMICEFICSNERLHNEPGFIRQSMIHAFLTGKADLNTKRLSSPLSREAWPMIFIHTFDPVWSVNMEPEAPTEFIQGSVCIISLALPIY